MKPAAKLSLYGAVLVLVFAAAWFTASMVVDESTVERWVQDTEDNHHGGSEGLESEDSEPDNTELEDNGDDHGH